MAYSKRRKEYELRAALDHPVFAQPQARPCEDQYRHNRQHAMVADDDPERRPVAEGILRFFDVANNYWADCAATSAPELSILMDLYINEQDHRSVSVGDACIAARVPSTSALRSIDSLIGSGMVIRYPDPRDSRRKLLQLTDLSRSLVRGFVDEVGSERRRPAQ
ncbi:helix-turn-helix domain-containing protein [Flavisphingomonas formosensis]|uniref:hypothetical protein n=1 Tax=Flavisphingomonas formosensis TaxID=861534 RepID=UPI0012FB2B99|nr:hypothetical protein [Sphingomonas formosensis]